MFFAWLKRYMPRSLYGRAALILILPVVSLQLVLSVVIAQRHFEGVTRQMSVSVSREIRLLMAPETSQETKDSAAQMLDIEMQPVQSEELPTRNLRRWYDFSAFIVFAELEQRVPGILAIELPDDNVVRVFVQGAEGPVQLEFDRLRISARNPHQLFANMLFFLVRFLR